MRRRGTVNRRTENLSEHLDRGGNAQLAAAPEGCVVGRKKEGVQVPDLDGGDALGQGQSKQDYDISAGIGARSRLQTQYVGLIQTAVLGQPVARLTGLMSKDFQLLGELQSGTFLLEETDPE